MTLSINEQRVMVMLAALEACVLGLERRPEAIALRLDCERAMEAVRTASQWLVSLSVWNQAAVQATADMWRWVMALVDLVRAGGSPEPMVSHGLAARVESAVATLMSMTWRVVTTCADAMRGGCLDAGGLPMELS